MAGGRLVVMLAVVSLLLASGAEGLQTDRGSSSLDAHASLQTLEGVLNAALSRLNANNATSNVTTNTTGLNGTKSNSTLNGNQTVATNGTANLTNMSEPIVDWPRDGRGMRFKGGKEFVIVMHDRIELDILEMNTFLNKSIGKRDRRVRRLKRKINETHQEMKPHYTRIAVIHKKLRGIFKSLKVLRVDMEKKLIAYRKLEVKINNVAHNWNRTIGSIESQLGAAKTAVSDIDTIFKMLDSGSSEGTQRKSIADMLMKMKKRSYGHTKLVSLIELAMAKTETMTDVQEVSRIVALLRRQIIAHIGTLSADAASSKSSRDDHLKRMRVKLRPHKFEIQKLERRIKVTLKAIGAEKQEIQRIKDKYMAEGLKQIQLYRNRIQKIRDAHKAALGNWKSELASIMEMSKTMGSLHQIVKQRLVAGSDKDIAVLNSLQNPLRPRGQTRLVWNPNLAATPKKCNKMLPMCQISQAIDPKDASSHLCGSWKFDEPDGQRFALDSSESGFDGKIHGHNLLRVRSQMDLGHRGGLSFDGAQSYVDVGKLGTFGSSMNQFTFDIWVRTINTDPSLSSIVKVIDNGIGQVMAIEANRRLGKPVNGKWPTGQQRTAVTDFESGSTLVYLRDSKGHVLAGHVRANYFDNRWHNIRWTVVNAKNNQMTFYLDDKRVPFKATVEQSPSVFHNLNQNIYIGAGNNRGHPEGFFDGALHSVRLFCTADWNATEPVPLCCRSCNTTVGKACGDMCIALNATCMLEVGCACNATVQEQKSHGWPMRGNSPYNKQSLFSNNPGAIPTTPSKFIIPRRPLQAPVPDNKPGPGAGKTTVTAKPASVVTMNNIPKESKKAPPKKADKPKVQKPASPKATPPKK